MITPEIAADLVGEALQLTTVLVTILVVPSLVVGLLVALFQAATQINEATLSFIPKLVAAFLILLLAGPWMLQLLVDYIRRLFESIPQLIG